MEDVEISAILSSLRVVPYPTPLPMCKQGLRTWEYPVSQTPQPHPAQRDGGREEGWHEYTVVLGMGCLLSHIPMQGKEEKGRPSQATFPIPISSIGGNKERAAKDVF